jgi:formylglycine-generating enzyme required for sulfatase activity
MRALPEAEIAGVRERIEAFLRAPEPAVRRAAVDLLIGTGLGGAEAAAAGVDAATNLQRVRVNPLDRGELILVPAGMFKVGSEEDSNNPPREMDLPSFYLARYPVTNAQYRLFLEANPEEAKSRFWDDERFNQDQQPVVHVSWHQAKAYCDWAGARLPTEWEWEKAARGSDGRIFPWGNTQPDESRAAFANPGGVPSPVGSFPAGASPYGHLDMAGNVWEWTALLFEKGEGWRTCRGGCFSHMAALLRASFRLSVLPVDRYIFIGFRCAQDP